MGLKSLLERRPILIVLAGPNGAGKSTYYRAHLEPSGLRFVNADVVAQEMQIDSYTAKGMVDQIRHEFIQQKESFIFETVFSDPVGDKLNYFKNAEKSGYTVVLIFIGVSGPEISSERVAMRVMKGGHDVPEKKIIERYKRVMPNLKNALTELSNVLVYDNSDLDEGYRLVATRKNGQSVELHGTTPKWLRKLLP